MLKEISDIFDVDDEESFAGPVSVKINIYEYLWLFQNIQLVPER